MITLFLKRWIGGGMVRRVAQATVCSVLLAAAGVAWEAMPAYAYPQEQGGCFDSSLTYHFDDSAVDWSATKKGYVNDAFGKLNDPKDHDGGQLVSVANQNTSGTIQVKLVELGTTEFAGNFECDFGASIKFNQSHSTAAKFFWRVGRHELMHAAGAKHGGEFDSQDGVNETTMSTCNLNIDTWRNNNIFEQDGKAYLHWLHSSWGSNHVVNANGGFESGKDFWDYPESAELKETGGVLGPRYVRWFSTTTDQDFRTVTRLITGDDDENYRAAGFFRMPEGAASGVAKVELWRRTIDLPNNPQNPNGCVYPDGITNANGSPNSQQTGSWVKINEVAFDNLSGDSWKYFNTGWVDAINYEALDFKVVARGRTTQSPGNYGAVWIDDLTVQGS